MAAELTSSVTVEFPAAAEARYSAKNEPVSRSVPAESAATQASSPVAA